MKEGEIKSDPPAAQQAGPATGSQPPPDEFAHIPTPRSRPPFIAIAAVLLSVFLGYRLRHDVRYALSSSTPIPVEASALVRLPAADVPVNRYVRLAGTPERESAVILDTQGSWEYHQLFRVRSTRGRVFVRRIPDPVPVAQAEKDEFTGRLVPFSELSFARSIDRYFSSRIAATHFFKAADLHAALRARTGGGPLALADLAGDRLSLGGGERLFVDISRPDEVQVELSRQRFREKAAAARAIDQAAAGAARRVSDRETADRFIFMVSVPADPTRRAQVLSALGDLDRHARLRPARDTVEAAVSDLSATEGGLELRRPDGQTMAHPLERIASVRTRAAVKVPEDALLLIEAEKPRDAWKSLLVLAVLVVFFAVNLLALRRPS